MNRQLLERKISMIDDEALAGKNAWKGWREMRIKNIGRVRGREIILSRTQKRNPSGELQPFSKYR